MKVEGGIFGPSWYLWAHLTSSARSIRHAVVAFSPNVGSALNSAVIGIVGSILGGALGMMIIALISALAMGFDYEEHSVTMVG